jgi:pectate lyase
MRKRPELAAGPRARIGRPQAPTHQTRDCVRHKESIRTSGLLLMLMTGFALAAVPVAARPAFPGAQGHGANAQGGRGGRIVRVTNLNDAGAGSLRACIETKGPRVCVFAVSGVIRFTSRRPLITEPRLTIAGETAPGGGIVLTHAGGPDGLTPIAIKGTSNIVIRHIRVRPDRLGSSRSGASAFTIENSRDVVLDHVSGSWAQDENLTNQGFNTNITVSNAILAEGIPRHDKCALLASDPARAQRYSFVRSLCAHNGDRNPDANFPPGSCVEVTNNIFYNAQSQFAEVWEGAGGTPISFRGNVFRRGPNTTGSAAAIDRVSIGSLGTASIHATGNMVDGNMLLFSLAAGTARVASPACKPASPVLPARSAWVEVLTTSGALPRDEVDRRIVKETISRSGRIRREPGRLPVLAAGRPYPDVDADGMDDRWEASNGANPRSADPWGDADGDGWANLEEFLDWRHRLLVQAARQSISVKALTAALDGQDIRE